MSEGNEGNDGEPKAPGNRSMEDLFAIFGEPKEAVPDSAEGEVSWEEAVIEKEEETETEAEREQRLEQERKAAHHTEAGVTHGYDVVGQETKIIKDLFHSAGQTDEGEEGDDK